MNLYPSPFRVCQAAKYYDNYTFFKIANQGKKYCFPSLNLGISQKIASSQNSGKNFYVKLEKSLR